MNKANTLSTSSICNITISECIGFLREERKKFSETNERVYIFLNNIKGYESIADGPVEPVENNKEEALLNILYSCIAEVSRQRSKLDGMITELVSIA